MRPLRRVATIFILEDRDAFACGCDEDMMCVGSYKRENYEESRRSSSEKSRGCNGLG